MLDTASRLMQAGATPSVSDVAEAAGVSRATVYRHFRNRDDLVILVEGDQQLFNQYGVMVVNPARHPHVKQDLAQAFADWVVSPAGQAAIASYKIGGEQLFFPNAGR